MTWKLVAGLRSSEGDHLPLSYVEWAGWGFSTFANGVMKHPETWSWWDIVPKCAYLVSISCIQWEPSTTCPIGVHQCGQVDWFSHSADEAGMCTYLTLHLIV